MHVRVRIFGKPDTIVVVDSKLTKIEQFRRIIKAKFDIDIKLQRLFYGGKLLEDGYTFHDYNIKLNDVIQLMLRIHTKESAKEEEKVILEKKSHENVPTETCEPKILYIDAKSNLYQVGDLIDMKDREQGAWFEGKIVRIVHDPDYANPCQDNSLLNTSTENQTASKESDSENRPPTVSLTADKKKGIAKYFTKSSLPKKGKQEECSTEPRNSDKNLLYKVQLDDGEDDSDTYCKLKEIRPRARNCINLEDLKVGDKVMINYNTDQPYEKGYWYDFCISEIKKLRSNYELIGTLYLGPEAVPQNDTKVKIHDNVFAIEEVVPLALRTESYQTLISTPTEKRSVPLNCLRCRDNEDTPCKECGCYLCSGKELPEKIILCDECNNGYHMQCLSPPLVVLPEEDWYCPSCKRDPNDIVAPGGAKQIKKATLSKTTRDWGRGMACVGKTKTCAMPPNHFGPIPGIEVGMCWRFRIQLSESGVHRPPVSGIHGRDVEGAYSIVLSGGYEDDVDNGIEFTYTGSGGRDLSGNKRTAEQSCDQTLTRENKALARNCAVNQISESGGDAGDNWRNGKPVRVVRSYKMLKHFPKYAPKEGIRYDGIYKVVKYYPEKGLSGYRVWKYLLRRDDPSPAPWEPEAKKYPIVYPDGYLEAEAEKKAQKQKSGKGGKKRALRENNQTTDSEGDTSPPGKKRKITIKDENNAKKKNRDSVNKTGTGTPIVKITDIFNTSITTHKHIVESTLSSDERTAIKADTVNSKLWDECLEVCERRGRKGFVEHVTQMFLCIICQEVAVSPVTTPCAHNFCKSCLKLAYKSTGTHCPCCRQDLSKYDPEPNDKLKAALQCIMAGYDAGKK